MADSIDDEALHLHEIRPSSPVSGQTSPNLYNFLAYCGIMPRDLFASDTKDESLVASPRPSTPTPDRTEVATATGNDGYREFTIHRDESTEPSVRQIRGSQVNADEKGNLHPYVQTLSQSDLESCVALENAVFPEQERCSREKLKYRLSTCPELCLGLFSSTASPPSTETMPTFPSANPADSATPKRRSVLVAMIIANRTSSTAVTDESMDLPPDWGALRSTPKETRGHQDHGRTICIHSLGVLPAYQGRGLAKMLMKSYEQRMETSGIADRIALLAHEHLLRMYEGMGFVDKGKSPVKFGGGGWTNLIYDFAEHAPGMTFQG